MPSDRRAVEGFVSLDEHAKASAYNKFRRTMTAVAFDRRSRERGMFLAPGWAKAFWRLKKGRNCRSPKARGPEPNCLLDRSQICP